MKRLMMGVSVVVILAAVCFIAASAVRAEVPIPGNAPLEISEAELQAMAAKLPTVELKKEVPLERE